MSGFAADHSFLYFKGLEKNVPTGVIVLSNLNQKILDKRLKRKSVYQLIYTVVLQIPFGLVATYGQIAKIVGGCTPRMVGYAMAALNRGADVPWQRVINHKGRISARKSGPGDIIQRKLLEMEGVEFDGNDGIDLKKFRWMGPAGLKVK